MRRWAQWHRWAWWAGWLCGSATTLLMGTVSIVSAQTTPSRNPSSGDPSSLSLDRGSEKERERQEALDKFGKAIDKYNVDPSVKNAAEMHNAQMEFHAKDDQRETDGKGVVVDFFNMGIQTAPDYQKNKNPTSPPPTPPPTSIPTRDDLTREELDRRNRDLTADEQRGVGDPDARDTLDRQIKAWNDAHPDAPISTSGPNKPGADADTPGTPPTTDNAPLSGPPSSTTTGGNLPGNQQSANPGNNDMPDDRGLVPPGVTGRGGGSDNVGITPYHANAGALVDASIMNQPGNGPVAIASGVGDGGGLPNQSSGDNIPNNLASQEVPWNPNINIPALGAPILAGYGDNFYNNRSGDLNLTINSKAQGQNEQRVEQTVTDTRLQTLNTGNSAGNDAASTISTSVGAASLWQDQNNWGSTFVNAGFDSVQQGFQNLGQTFANGAANYVNYHINNAIYGKPKDDGSSGSGGGSGGGSSSGGGSGGGGSSGGGGQGPGWVSDGPGGGSGGSGSSNGGGQPVDPDGDNFSGQGGMPPNLASSIANGVAGAFVGSTTLAAGGVKPTTNNLQPFVQNTTAGGQGGGGKPASSGGGNTGSQPTKQAKGITQEMHCAKCGYSTVFKLDDSGARNFGLDKQKCPKCGWMMDFGNTAVWYGD